jgi:pilus assembly protein CpaF
MVQQARLKDGSRRIVAISEVIGMEGDVITMQDLFQFDYAMGLDAKGRFQGTLKSTGLRPRVLDALADHGVAVDPHLFTADRFARR